MDPIAIFVLDWGIEGAAIATVSGQILSFLVTIAYLGRFKLLTIEKRDYKLKWQYIKSITPLGISGFINQMAIVVMTAVLNNILVLYGKNSAYGSEIPLAVIGIVLKVNQILLFIIVGIASGAQPLISYNYGANKPERIRGTIFWALALCLCFTGMMFLISRVLPHYFVRIFTANPEYQELAVWGIQVFTMMIIPLSFQYVFVDSLTALGMTRISLGLSLIRKILYFGTVCLLPLVFSAKSAFYGEPVADGLSAAITSLAFFGIYRKYLKGQGRLEAIRI